MAYCVNENEREEEDSAYSRWIDWEWLYSKKACIKDGYGGKYISGEDYQKWLMICTRYLQHLYPNDPQTEYFTKVAERANGNDDKNFDILISILNAIKELPVINSTESIDDVLIKYLQIFTDVLVRY